MGLFSAPEVKYAGEVDLSKGVGDTISINDQHFQRAAGLTSKVNKQGQQEALNLLEQAMPGITKVRGMLMNNLQRELTETGLPAEVEANLARKAAEMGVTRGTRGDFNKFSALRDLGVEHMKMLEYRKQMARSTMQQLFQATPRINPMSPSAMMLTPGQTIQTMSQNLDRRQAYYNAQAQAEAQKKANILGAISGVVGAAATLGSAGILRGAAGGMGAGMAVGAGVGAASSAAPGAASGAINYSLNGLGYTVNPNNPFGYQPQ